MKRNKRPTDIINSWIYRLLRHVKKKRGFQNKMTKNGHFSAHLFSPKEPLKEISLEHVIRMLVNYAMICKNTELVHEFKDDWNQLGDAIVEMAENGVVDMLNQLFDPKTIEK